MGNASNYGVYTQSVGYGVCKYNIAIYHCHIRCDDVHLNNACTPFWRAVALFWILLLSYCRSLCFAKTRTRVCVFLVHMLYDLLSGRSVLSKIQLRKRLSASLCRASLSVCIFVMCLSTTPRYCFSDLFWNWALARLNTWPKHSKNDLGW